MSDCIFCKIVKGELPSTVVYEDDKLLAFKDIYPEAPVHILIVPKFHVPSIKELDSSNVGIVADIHLAANKIAEKLGISESGYRLLTNCGEEVGQTVFHLHYHLLGGKKLTVDKG